MLDSAQQEQCASDPNTYYLSCFAHDLCVGHLPLKYLLYFTSNLITVSQKIVCFVVKVTWLICCHYFSVTILHVYFLCELSNAYNCCM